MFPGSDSSTIAGLAIGGVTGGSGIVISNSSKNTIAGCFIGTDATGATAVPNGFNGVVIANSSSNNIVGGTAARARNIISANGNNVNNQGLRPGVFIEEGTTGALVNIGGIPGTAATGNVVQNNLIGTNASGTGALGNGVGVQVFSAAAATTGTIISGNLVSGNAATGIEVDGPQTSGTVVQNNLVGTTASGTVALPNAGNGINLVGASNNTIGGTSTGGNVVSGNGGSGIGLSGGANSNTISIKNLRRERRSILRSVTFGVLVVVFWGRKLGVELLIVV